MIDWILLGDVSAQKGQVRAVPLTGPQKTCPKIGSNFVNEQWGEDLVEVVAMAFRAPTQLVLAPFVLGEARARLSAPQFLQSKPLFAKRVGVQSSLWLDRQLMDRSPSNYII